ncbi:MAG: DUF4339 domain-containing protein [Planctomycetes bacterium]|nr:DUF4339 domain-containing protein [Planctomycetota bacterium]
MSNQWYYGQDGARLGPYSEQELKELAASGGILGTDTIWKEGVDRGAPASMVKNLFSRVGQATIPMPLEPATPSLSVEHFPAIQADTSVSSDATLVPSNPDLAVLAENTEPKPEETTPTTLDRSGTPQRTEKKGKATGVRGVMLIGQDGEIVRYKKKCIKCGYLDLCASKMAIKSGTIRGTFFCPKCRKTGEVVMQCNS